MRAMSESSSSGGQPLLFCKGLDAVDVILKLWTDAQQQQQRAHDIDATASPASNFPFKDVSSDELQAVARMMTQVLSCVGSANTQFHSFLFRLLRRSPRGIALCPGYI